MDALGLISDTLIIISDSWARIAYIRNTSQKSVASFTTTQYMMGGGNDVHRPQHHSTRAKPLSLVPYALLDDVG